MGRPRKLDSLTSTISGRIRPEQELWLQHQAEKRFDGELSRTLRWALDQASEMTWLLQQDDPVGTLDRLLNPQDYEPPDREDEIAEAEREFEGWKREQAIKRAQRKRAST